MLSSISPMAMLAGSLGFFLGGVLLLLRCERLVQRVGTNFCVRIGSFLHAVGCVALMLYCAAASPPGRYDAWMLPENPLLSTADAEQVALCFSLGYFLADMVVMLMHPETSGALFFAHHAVAILGLLIPTVALRYGTVVVTTMFWLELTNPFMQGRWMLRRLLGLDPQALPARRAAALELAAKQKPLLLGAYRATTRVVLVLFVSRFVYLPVASYRGVVNIGPATPVDFLYVAQQLSAVAFFVPSFQFYVDAVAREMNPATAHTFDGS